MIGPQSLGGIWRSSHRRQKSTEHGPEHEKRQHLLLIGPGCQRKPTSTTFSSGKVQVTPVTLSFSKTRLLAVASKTVTLRTTTFNPGQRLPVLPRHSDDPCYSSSLWLLQDRFSQLVDKPSVVERLALDGLVISHFCRLHPVWLRVVQNDVLFAHDNRISDAFCSVDSFQSPFEAEVFEGVAASRLHELADDPVRFLHVSFCTQATITPNQNKKLKTAQFIVSN